MSDMIERVQDAIDEVLLQSIELDLVKEAARAAIKAMREPTDEQWQKTADMLIDGGFPQYSFEQVWQAMIDAALNEDSND